MYLHVPTTIEIHQIAYLTMHGWEPSYDGETWSKPGFQTTRTVTRACGCHTDEVPTNDFDLESAYDAQQKASTP